MHLVASVIEQQQREFELAGAPAGWARLLGLLLLVAMGYVVVWMYRRESRVGAGARLRYALAALRCLVLLLLAVIWTQPVIATYLVRTSRAGVAVLVDVSGSMSIADAPQVSQEPGQPSGDLASTRRERVATLLGSADSAWLRRLAARNELQLYAFGADAQLINWPWERTGDPAAGNAASVALGGFAAGMQRATDAGRAVTAALDGMGDSPVAGIVLVSDGGLNQGLSVAGLAALAQRYGAPIHTIGVGAAQAPANVRIASIAAPATVPQNDPFEVRIELAASGVARAELEVELSVEPLDEAVRSDAANTQGEQILARRQVVLDADTAAPPLLFQVTPAGAGRHLYRARISPLEREIVQTDNAAATTVLVLAERTRVLIVAGRPSYDYRYLARLLERDNSVELSCWLQSADVNAVRDGDTVIREMPRRPDDIFAYDAIILMDPNPRGLDAGWALVVRRWIEEFGGGLLLEAGTHFSTRFLQDADAQELVAILPIIPEADAEVRLSEQGAFRTRAQTPHIPEEIRDHPLLALHADVATSAAIWRALPGVWWHLPVARAKPLATVLLQRGEGTAAERLGSPILMATQPVGSGRTVFLGFDDTWRWRATGERYFNRFWIQLVRYLAQSRRQGGTRRGTIVLERETIDVGDHVKIEARLLDESFAPWSAPELEARLEFEDGSQRALTLKAITGRDGWFGGRVTIEQAGSVAIRVPLPDALGDDARSLAQAPVRYLRVNRADAEARTVRLQVETLRELAEHTGGTYLPVSEADALPERIENADRISSARGPNENLWDRTWVLLVLAAALTVEWTLRRRSHLL